MIKIDENVPIPPRVGNPANLQPRARKYPWLEMKVGQSFFVPLPLGRTFSAHSCWLKNNKKTKLKFETRRVVEDGNHGVRIWRTK
jgi:hypothetical protein